MKQLHLSGSYYEMGVQYGKLLKERSFRLKDIPPSRMKIAHESNEHYESFFPDILEELKGIADTTDINYEQLCAFTLVLPLRDHGCTNFAITDGNQTYVGRNYDWYFIVRRTVESYLTEPKNNFKSVGQTHVFLGREDGMNEKGLAIAMNGIFGAIAPGISYWLATRYILDKCRNVSEAIDFLSEIPHNRTTNFLLADKNGAMVVVEASPKLTVVREPYNNCIVSTNHWLNSKMNYQKYRIPPDSKKRYSFAKSAIVERKVKLDHEFLLKILTNHDGLICSHNHRRRFGTVWSTIFNTTTNEIWRADEQPCMAEYQKDNRLLS